MASPPRVSLPFTIWKLTHVITTREFLLRPDEIIVQLILYILAVCSRRHSLRVHLATVLSNHLHLLLTDVLGDRIQPFNRDFFSLLTRAINVARNRSGNLFDPARVNCVDVCPRAEDIIDHGTYVSMNAVAAGLVDRAKKWKGVNFLPSEMGTLEIEIHKPKIFFRKDKGLPEKVTLKLEIPEAVDCPPEILRARMIEEHDRQEREKRQAMAKARRTFMGMKRVMRQSVHSRPAHRPPLFERVPHVACKDVKLRVHMLEWRKSWRARYREALQRARDGDSDVLFPIGTWFQHYFCGRAREAADRSIWYALMSLP